MKRPLQSDHSAALTALVENAREFAMLTTDCENCITSWNPGAERLMGWSEEEMLGRSGAEIFTPEDREKGEVDKELRIAAEEGRAANERWHLRKDGSRFWGSGIMHALYNPAGRHIGFGKVMRDATERRKQEEERLAILEAERRARAEAEATARRLNRLQLITDVALAQRSLDGLLSLLLERIRQALEVDTAVVLLLEGEMLVVRAISGLDAPEDREVRIPVGEGFVGRIAASREPLAVEDTSTFPFHTPILRERGVRSLLGVPLFVGGSVLGVLHVGTFNPRRFDEDDLHLLQLVAERAALAIERARVEQVQQQQQARLSLLAEITGELLFTEQPETFIERLYHRLASHLDLEVYVHYGVAEDGAGLKLRSCRGIPEEVAQEIARLEFGQAVCGTVAQERCPVVEENVGQSGCARTALVRSMGIRAYACHPLIAQERLIGTLSFGTRKRDHFAAEDVELIRTVCDQVALAMERARLAGELALHARELESADLRKNEFLAILAHEMRTPISAVSTALYVLEGLDLPSDRGARQVSSAARQTRQLARLVDDLLDVSRITQGKLDLRKERADLVRIARHAAETSLPLLEARGQQFDCDLPSDPLPVDADPVRMEQVVTNLLNNAAKYTDTGGYIRLRVFPEGPHAVLEVRDTGTGIDPAMLPHIFDLFTQVDPTGTHSRGGLGIGLTLVRRLVELHDGSVSAHSEGPGHGSEFTVRLPAISGQ